MVFIEFAVGSAVRTMMRRVRQGLAIAETVAALALAWILVFVVPFRRTAAWLGHPVAPGESIAVTPRQLLRARFVCRRVARVGAGVPWRATCLVRAIAGRLLLKRRGIAASIRFGVKKDDGELAAHAWLIVGGETLLGGSVAQGFVPLADIGSKPT